MDRFFHALYSAQENNLMPFLLGTACSEVTETLAKIVPYWNMVQVSFGSTTPALSDTREFPLFLRTVAPDSSHNSARIALIKYFGWDAVTTFSQNGDMYSLVKIILRYLNTYRFCSPNKKMHIFYRIFIFRQ